MPNLHLDDNYLEELIKREVEERLAPYKREAMAVSMKQLTEMTSLSKETLNRHVMHEPEVQQWRRDIGGRIVYLYPDVRPDMRAVMDRKGLKHRWE